MVCFLAEVTHVPVRHLWRMVLFKDFFVLVLHHFVTIFLMTLSYTSNHHRIGAVIVLVHDASDFWMEGAKMSKYVGKHLTAQILFVIFTVVWFITRLTYYPFWILHTVFIYLPKVHSPLSPVETVLITLLALLQVLHIYWFYLILKIAMQVTKDPSQARDCRSDSEISDIAEGQSESGESLDGLSSSRPNGLSGMKGQYDGVVKESTDSGTDAHLQRRTVRVSRAGDDIS